MGLLDGIKRKAASWALSDREVRTSVLQAVLQHRPGSAVFQLDDTLSFYQEGYRKNPAVRTAVDLIADHAKQVEWRLHLGTGEDREDITDDPPTELRSLARILSSPNDRQGWVEHIEEVCINKLVAGEYFWELVLPDAQDRLLAIQNVSPLDVTIRTGQNAERPIEVYEVSAGQNQGRGGVYAEIEPERMLHGRFYDPENFWRGLSPLSAVARSVQRMNEYESWNVALAQNLGKTGGVLAYDMELTEEQADQAKERFSESHDAPGEVMVTGALKDYIETGMSPTDADWLDGMDNARELVAGVYGVPKEMMGIGSATFENRREARKVLYESSVLPLLRSIKNEFNRVLDRIYDDAVHVKLNTSGISALHEEESKKRERAIALFEKGLITDAEAREMVGLEPEPQGDGERFIPSSLLPRSAEGGDVEEEMSALAEQGYRPHYLSNGNE